MEFLSGVVALIWGMYFTHGHLNPYQEEVRIATVFQGGFKTPSTGLAVYLDLQQSLNKKAQYPKIESIGSIGSIILAILEGQVSNLFGTCSHTLSSWLALG